MRTNKRLKINIVKFKTFRGKSRRLVAILLTRCLLSCDHYLYEAEYTTSFIQSFLFMISPKGLRPPNNWQDFESLCKKLWGEIWQCPEIKKNGRNGQAQYGVDIYGIPRGEKYYIGIQCKGKDSHFGSGFKKEEILQEIEKVKLFQPALRKLYLATTAQKDAHIEGFVRETHVKHLEQGMFEVHLFSWEDIVDLIDENKVVHDWYVHSQQYRRNQEVSVAIVAPEDAEAWCGFKRVKAMQRLFTEKPTTGSLWDYLNLGTLSPLMNRGISPERENLSFFQMSLAITNSGSLPIEDYLVEISFKDRVQGISNTNKEGGLSGIGSAFDEVSIDDEQHLVQFLPRHKVLVPGQTRQIDFFVKPVFSIESSNLIVFWRLLSKDFKDSGEFTIRVVTFAIDREEYKYVNDPSRVGRVVEEIKDLYGDDEMDVE